MDHMRSPYFIEFIAILTLKMRHFWLFEGSPVIVQCIIPYPSTNTIIKKGRYRSYGY